MQNTTDARLPAEYGLLLRWYCGGFFSVFPSERPRIIDNKKHKNSNADKHHIKIYSVTNIK